MWLVATSEYERPVRRIEETAALRLPRKTHSIGANRKAATFENTALDDVAVTEHEGLLAGTFLRLYDNGYVSGTQSVSLVKKVLSLCVAAAGQTLLPPPVLVTTSRAIQLAEGAREMEP